MGPAAYPTLEALYKADEADRDPPVGTGTVGRFVPGEGPVGAAIALVGERPGNREDHEGRPFVGPAGELLDAALAEAGIVRAQLFVTNAIKRFRYVIRGKRRLHQQPNAGEIAHARWWLAQELTLVRPHVVVTLGATALQVLTGEARLGPVRGMVRMREGKKMLATVHPAWLLRLRDRIAREEQRKAFVADLERVRHAVERA